MRSISTQISANIPDDAEIRVIPSAVTGSPQIQIAGDDLGYLTLTFWSEEKADELAEKLLAWRRA